MSIFKKLANIQAGQPRVAKRGAANLGNRTYKYATLDDLLEIVLPMLTSQRLLLFQAVETRGEIDCLKTVIVDEESGEKIESVISLPPTSKWHDFGSGLTYARRYGLTGLLNIAADDDDDAHTANNNVGYSQPQQQRPQSQPQPRQQAANADPVPNCPDCGKRGMRSKYPSKDGLLYYCSPCKSQY